MDELEETIDRLENGVIEGMGDNPMRAYKLQFSYQVKFRLADDDNRTEVIIHSISEEMTFDRTRKDALHQKERNDAVSKDEYTKHIINWVEDCMGKSYFLKTCKLAYAETADVRKMTEEELNEYQREVISVAE